MAELKNCQFDRQIDESIDISNHAQLIAFVLLIDEGVISKISLLQEFTLHYKDQDVFDILTTYLKKHGLSWNSCVGICIDRAPSLVSLGSLKSFVSLREKHNPTIARTHCF